MVYNGNDLNPHDGQHGRCGCGQGYSWDENQSFRGGGNSGGNAGCASFILLILIVGIVETFNQSPAILIAIIGGFILFVKS